MKKTSINSTILFVVIATIALLLIQAFQTRQLFDKKSGQFKAEVQTTLDRIAVRHEKAEDVRNFLKIANTNYSGHYKDILKEEIQNQLKTKESITIKDTMIWENNSLENFLIITAQTIDTVLGLKAEQRVTAKDMRDLSDLYNGKNITDSTNISFRLDQKVVKKVFEKAKFINDMMMQAFKDNTTQNPVNRLDLLFLDSIIKTELNDDKLPSNYEFVVQLDRSLNIEPKKKIENYNTKLNLDHTFCTDLFPSNPFDENLKLYINFPNQNNYLIREIWTSLAVNLALIMLIFWALAFMFKTIITQKKLAEIKNDFISNMTHEIKTPISTISLVCQAMKDPDMLGEQSEKLMPYVNMIDEENKRLEILVQEILRSDTIDKEDDASDVEEVEIIQILKDISNRAKFIIDSKNGTLISDIEEKPIHLQTNKLHFSYAISNLVDNAIKYSKEIPVITIRLKQDENSIKISVQDQGIGIKREHQELIFEKLYRVPKGNVHNVKGFGLGLSYVKKVCDIYGWQIQVQSKLDEGSTFTIEIKN